MGGDNDHPSGASVASKVADLPRWAGRAVLEQAIVLWLLLCDPDVKTVTVYVGTQRRKAVCLPFKRA